MPSFINFLTFFLLALINLSGFMQGILTTRFVQIASCLRLDRRRDISRGDIKVWQLKIWVVLAIKFQRGYVEFGYF